MLFQTHLRKKCTRYKGAGKRSTGAYYKFWLAGCTADVGFVCLFFIFVFPFAPDLHHSQIMRLDMTYRIVNQSINQYIERLGDMGFTLKFISLSSNVKNSS